MAYLAPDATTRIVVRCHAGHSGKSVYRWRVYKETLDRDGKVHARHQIAKYKKEDRARRHAERLAQHLEERKRSVRTCNTCHRDVETRNGRLLTHGPGPNGRSFICGGSGTPMP